MQNDIEGYAIAIFQLSNYKEGFAKAPLSDLKFCDIVPI
jgi:hypothetical protein